jgi:zona occludens toxin
MAIYLNTGTPGAGKTLFTLWTVEQRRQKDNADLLAEWVKQGSDESRPPLQRDVYYFNINIKQLPWIKLHKPEDWLDAPIGSIFVFDECQEAFPPRSNSTQPPKYVSELAKARHGGYDLYFVTQHPTFVDPYVRKLAEEHNHLMRPFGAKRAVVHTWKGVKDNCDKSRKDSLTTSFAYPKQVYDWYKSSELHTHKFKLPTKVKLLLLLPFLLGICIYGVYKYFDNKYVKPSVPPALSISESSKALATSVTPKEYFDPASFNPRIADLPWSAPRYDDLTQPTIAPVIVGCMIFKKQCKCVTQQGTYQHLSMQFCLSTIENGIFQDFEIAVGRATKQESSQNQFAIPVSKPVSTAASVAPISDSGFNLPLKPLPERYLPVHHTQPSGSLYQK